MLPSTGFTTHKMGTHHLSSMVGWKISSAGRNPASLPGSGYTIWTTLPDHTWQAITQRNRKHHHYIMRHCVVSTTWWSASPIHIQKMSILRVDATGHPFM